MKTTVINVMISTMVQLLFYELILLERRVVLRCCKSFFIVFNSYDTRINFNILSFNDVSKFHLVSRESYTASNDMLLTPLKRTEKYRRFSN